MMPPTICCVRAQSVRDLVTEISAVPRRHRCGVAQSSSSELATQARLSQPHSRLRMPAHVGDRLASSGSPTHPSLGRLGAVPFSAPQRRAGTSITVYIHITDHTPYDQEIDPGHQRGAGGTVMIANETGANSPKCEEISQCTFKNRELQLVLA